MSTDEEYGIDDHQIEAAQKMLAALRAVDEMLDARSIRMRIVDEAIDFAVAAGIE